MSSNKKRRSSALVRYRLGLFAHLPKRAWLTIRYQHPLEALRRAFAFPVRALSPAYDKRVRETRIHGADAKAATRWYRRKGKPVTVVIPTHGDPQLALDALESVRRTTDASRVKVLIVDDGSPEDVRQTLAAVEGAEVIFGEEQAGFAANVNRGIRASNGDVVLLNSDIIAHPGWLERLQHAAYVSDSHGVVGGRLLYGDRRIQFGGMQRNLGAPEWFDHRYRFRAADFGPATVSGPTLGITGACMYVKREVLDEVGLMDEEYPMAYEDIDYSLRAWLAGWSCVYWPAAELTHLESITRGTEQNEREVRSQKVFWDKWGSFFERDVLGPDGELRIVYVTEDTDVGGGHRDIFEHVNRLKSRGHDVQLFSLGGQPEWFDLDAEVRQFDTYEDLAEALEPLDAIKVATWWNTANWVWTASVRNGLPVYLVQDIETSYYPHDEAMRNQVLATYRNEFAYMTISGWNRDRLREIGLEPTIVAPGIDLETFRPLAGTERREDLLLAIGRSNPLKNLPLTIDARGAMGDSQAELQLFGSEPELGRKYGLSYIERPSDEEVNELFNQCTVFVQTSVHEGFCLPPLEAMASGTAVVCTDAHGNRDFCRDGVNCLMPDPEPRAVAGAVERLLADPGLRARVGEAGMQTAADYAWEKRIDELERFFVSAAEEGYAGSPPVRG